MKIWLTRKHCDNDGTWKPVQWHIIRIINFYISCYFVLSDCHKESVNFVKYMSDEITKRVQDAIFAFSIGDDDHREDSKASCCWKKFNRGLSSIIEVSLSLEKLDENHRNALLILILLRL